jgi:hypothetical protein
MGDAGLIQKLFFLLGIFIPLILLAAFLGGVLRPVTVLPYKCYAWDIKVDHYEIIGDWWVFELREPVWHRSCIAKQ